MMQQEARPQGEKPGLFSTLAAIALIATTIAITAWLSQPPAVRSGDADGRFSTARAMAQLDVIAQRPHPTGSAENARVRDALVEQLRSIGLQVHVQRALVTGDASAGVASFAWIENVVAVLPGEQRDDALLLMSHYDSTPWAPGAADAGAGVVAVLEAARVAAATAPASRKRDLIVLLSDGEELGLFGARGFFERDPLAKRVGTVLNFESRGSRGPALMFQTGPGNADLIRILARGPAPAANSFAQEIYKRMPNDTDFTVSLAARRAGLNFAFVDGYFDYHSPTDSPRNLSPETLQHLGDQAVDATTALLTSPSPAAGGGKDLHYLNFTGKAFFFYPPWVDAAALGLATLLSVVALLRAHRTRRMKALATLRAALGTLVTLGCAAAVVWSLAAAVRAGFWPGAMVRAVAAHQTSWFIAWLLVGSGVTIAVLASATRSGLRWPAALLLAIAASLLALRAGGVFLPGAGLAALAWLLLRRPIDDACMAWGVRLLGLALAWALVIALPGAANLLVWLLLAFSIVTLLVGRDDDPPRASTRIAAAIAVVIAAVILGDFARSLDLALGITLPVAGVIPVSLLLALSVLPWQGTGARVTGVALAIAGAVLAVALSLQHPFDARHPRPSGIFVLQDRLLDVDCLASIDAATDDWQDAVMGKVAKPLKRNNFAPEVWRETRCAPLGPRSALLPAVPPLTIQTLSIVPAGTPGVRRLQLRLRAAGGRDRLDLYLPEGVDVRAAQVDGRALPVPTEQGLEDWPRRLRAVALPDEDVTLELDIGPGQLPEALLAVTRQHGMPAALPLPPRPHDSMPQTHEYSDARIVVERVQLARSPDAPNTSGPQIEPTRSVP
jgi:hypothetical protein